MNPLLARETQPKGKGQTAKPAVSFAPLLRAGELLAGTPTVVADPSGELTFSSLQITSQAMTINGVEVAAGKAITVLVAGGEVKTYTLWFRCDTDQGQLAVPVGCLLDVVEDGR